MKRIFALLLPLLAALALPASAHPTRALRLASTQPQVVPNQWVVKYAPGASAAVAAWETQTRAHSIARIPQLNVETVETTSPDAVSVLARDPRILWIEPNRMRYALALAAPNDPSYKNKDYLNATDPSLATWFKWDAHLMGNVAAWGVWPGKYYSATKPKSVPGVRIAILDTGIDTGHPDFKNAGGTSTDSAKGGQLDLALDRSFLNGTITPGAHDGFGHGTHVAGIAAASVNNGKGVTGNGYNATVLPLRVLDGNGAGTETGIAQAIVYAADNGALIENMSIGGYGFSQVEQDAVNYAWSRGTLCIAAAGNDGSDTMPNYPAALSRVLAVAATARNNSLASYSDYGDYLGLSAPGGDFDIDYGWFLDIYSTMPTYYVTLNNPNVYGATKTYSYLEGTSMASPQVAGLAALYAGYQNITQQTPNAPLVLWQALQRCCNNNGGGVDWNPTYGYGRINASKLMHLPTTPNPRGATSGCITGFASYRGTRVINAAITATPVGGGTPTSTVSRADGGYRIVNVTPGVYSVTATIFDEWVTYPTVTVSLGCDTPGQDFNVGAFVVTPAVSSLSPAAATSGGGDFTLSVTGAGFLYNSVVQWNGTPLATTYLSPTLVSAAVPAADIASAGAVTVTVVNPDPGGASTSTSFPVN